MAKLYGVGVGPGDPELMTLKAVNTIKKCSVIAFPHRKTAYEIALAACPEIKHKKLVSLELPMTKSKEEIYAAHKKAAFILEEYIKNNEDTAFLTLGDPCIYSTFMYIERIVSMHGYETRIISGVPSFCAASAAFKISLADGKKQIHISAGDDDIDEVLNYNGCRIFMKAGKSLKNINDGILKAKSKAYVAVNCTMDNERLYTDIADIIKTDGDIGYFSLVIVKDEKD